MRPNTSTAAYVQELLTANPSVVGKVFADTMRSPYDPTYRDAFKPVCNILIDALGEVTDLFGPEPKVSIFGRVLSRDSLKDALSALAGQTAEEAWAMLDWIDRAATLHEQYYAATGVAALLVNSDRCHAISPSPGCCIYHGAVKSVSLSKSQLHAHMSDVPWTYGTYKNGPACICKSTSTGAVYPGILSPKMHDWVSGSAPADKNCPRSTTVRDMRNEMQKATHRAQQLYPRTVVV